MRCRHRNIDEILRIDPPRNGRQYCRDCKEWLSLGPSNDDDPDVQIEIRAAEIVAIKPPHGWIVAIAAGLLSELEAHGLRDDPDYAPWDSQAFEFRRINEHDPRWLAGYLARCIEDHEEDA